MTTTAGDVKLTPASTAWTEFNVTDVDGTVRTSARKGDLTISDGKQTVTLAQGQQTTRDESADPPPDKKDRKNRKAAAGASAVQPVEFSTRRSQSELAAPRL